MSARYEADVPVTIQGEQEDVLFRAAVSVTSSARSTVAEPDGAVEAWSEALSCWVDPVELGVSAADAERALDVICEHAMELDYCGGDY